MSPSTTPSSEPGTCEQDNNARGEHGREQVDKPSSKSAGQTAVGTTESANRMPKGVGSMPSVPAKVNSGHRGASNRAERRREANEDRELVEKAQAGDMAAFRRLVERHQRRAFAIAIGLVRDEQDAQEIVQEAFLRVYRSLDRFKGGSSFFTWLYRIVTNLSIDLMRKPARREAELFDEPQISDQSEVFSFISRIDGADPIDVARRREIAQRIQQALESLPPYHRSVILMREVEGMSYQQMAKAMNVSKGTIMSRLFHARQKLQKALADCYREQYGRDPAGRGNKT